MSIEGVSSSSALVQPSGAVGSSELGKSDFMTLFITQLQYQDPMKPMDSGEMASQLAQFSNMEATTKMSEDMEKLLEYQTSQNNLQLLTLLGTDIQVNGNRMGVVDGTITSTEFALPEASSSTVIEIYDAADNLIWQQDRGALSGGTYELNWDGKNMVGDSVEDGAYSYVVNALDPLGQSIESEYRSTGTVTGISFETGSAVLTMDGFINTGVDQVVNVKNGTEKINTATSGTADNSAI